MRIVDRSLPYPVLSPLRDDVSPNRFELTCDCRSDAKNYYLAYEFGHDNVTLKEHVTSGAAAYAVHIEGRDCFYRLLHSKCPAKGVIEIPADDVAGTMEVTGFIVAKQDLPAYRLLEAHSDYGKATFSVRAGDVLACTRTFTFEAEKEFDPLKKLSSIIQILPGEELEGPFTLDLDQGKITVFLSKNDYELYGQARHDPRVASTLTQGIVLPVLVTAIGDAAREREAEEPLPRWAQIIRQRLEAMRMDLELGIDKALEFAQALLQHPTHRFLNDLMRITEGESDEPTVSE